MRATLLTVAAALFFVAGSAVANESWHVDGDGLLSPAEVSDGVFGSYDEHGDGAWDAEEFAAYEEAEDWF